jgi:hypothetical protein
MAEIYILAIRLAAKFVFAARLARDMGNACDVGINRAMGEGWGLASFEHAAAGAAQVVPNHTACSEIWRERAELIPLAKSYIPEFSVLEMGEVSKRSATGPKAGSSIDLAIASVGGLPKLR